MWPFTFKAKTEVTAMSGIATCDGKNHTWSHWKQYTEEGIAFYPILGGKSFPYSERKQIRKCEICGFTEDRKVS